jgi:hypothetical protein
MAAAARDASTQTRDEQAAAFSARMKAAAERFVTILLESIKFDGEGLGKKAAIIAAFPDADKHQYASAADFILWACLNRAVIRGMSSSTMLHIADKVAMMALEMASRATTFTVKDIMTAFKTEANARRDDVDESDAVTTETWRTILTATYIYTPRSSRASDPIHDGTPVTFQFQPTEEDDTEPLVPRYYIHDGCSVALQFQPTEEDDTEPLVPHCYRY